MGKYRRNCKWIGEAAAAASMETSQVVGVTTKAQTLAVAAAAGSLRSSKKRKAVELQVSQETKSSRRRISRSPSSNSRGRISRCSSTSSCEQIAEENKESRLCSSDSEMSAVCYLGCCSRPRSREMSPSSNLRDSRNQLSIISWEAEIDEFFVEAERKEKLRFAERYNYDVDNDVPLDGRYEWVPLSPMKLSRSET